MQTWHLFSVFFTYPTKDKYQVNEVIQVQVHGNFIQSLIDISKVYKLNRTDMYNSKLLGAQLDWFWVKKSFNFCG